MEYQVLSISTMIWFSLFSIINANLCLSFYFSLRCN